MATCERPFRNRLRERGCRRAYLNLFLSWDLPITAGVFRGSILLPLLYTSTYNNAFSLKGLPSDVGMLVYANNLGIKVKTR